MTQPSEVETFSAQPSEDIVRKIQKLLSLATGGNNSQEEAASAMSMAQRMLARYNLDYYTVQVVARPFNPA